MRIIHTYVQEHDEDDLTYSSIESGQFFVGDDGWLWHKITDYVATSIADENQTPHAFTMAFKSDAPISRKIPKVAKIEF